MIINIREVIENKIKTMEESKIIESTIEKAIEKSVIDAINSALDGYSLKRDIEKKIETEVASVVSDIGFTAYNSFITERVKAITEGVCRADIAQKIQRLFNDMLLVKRDKIKLSEVFEAYRKWICDNTDGSEKYDLEHFYVKFEHDDHYDWYNIELGKERPEKYSSERDTVKFTLFKGSGKEKMSAGKISSTWIDGENVKDKIKLGRLTDFEALIVNLLYNETKIEIDVEDEDDIDCSFDIDR